MSIDATPPVEERFPCSLSVANHHRTAGDDPAAGETPGVFNPRRVGGKVGWL